MSSVSSAGGNSYYYTLQQNAFKKLDTDGNGTLDQSEVEAGKPKTVTNDQATKIYNNMDTDKSGGVTLDEFIKGTATGGGVGLINQLPTDAIDVLLKLQQGGALTQAAPAKTDDSQSGGNGGSGGGSGSGGQTFDPLDTNKDGIVSEQEFLAAHPEDAPKSASDTSSSSDASAASGANGKPGSSDSNSTGAESLQQQEQEQALAMLNTPPRLMGPDFFDSFNDTSGMGSLASMFGSTAGTQNGMSNIFQILANEQNGETSASSLL
jgi:hypothetical protein